MKTNDNTDNKNKNQLRANILKDISISFAGSSNKNKVYTRPLTEVIAALKHNKFAINQQDYILAKSKSKVNKWDFFPSFLPHAKYNGQHRLTDKISGEWDHTAWEMSELIHADLDGVSADNFDILWNKLITTKPLFMFSSPNGGIKAFWHHNLADTLLNRDMFQNICRYTIKGILNSLGLKQYYDDSPTTPNSRCYLTGGGDNFKPYLGNNFKTIDMQPAIDAVASLHNEIERLVEHKSSLLKRAKQAGDYTYYQDFSDNYKATLQGWADNALQESIKATTNTGNGSSFKLACRLFNMGLDKNTVAIYLMNFKAHSKKMAFDVNKQVFGAMNTTKSQLMGGKIQNDYYEKQIIELDAKLKLTHNKVSDLTHDDKTIAKRVDKAVKPVVDKPVIDKAVKLSDLSDIDATIFTGLPGSGKSYKMVRQSVDNMLYNKITLYVCHNLDAFNSTVKDSRYHEATKYLNELLMKNKITRVKHDRHLLNLQTISSDKNEDGKSSAPVNIQFSSALNDLQSMRKGGIIFLTMRALELINLDELIKGQSTIVFDDVSDLPKAKKLSDNFTNKEVSDFKKFISFDVNGDTYKVKGITKEGLEYIFKHGDQGDKNAMVQRIEFARKAKDMNTATYYTFSSKDELSNRTTITQLDMLNLDVLKAFKQVYFIGDEIEFNPYVIMLKNRCGVMFNDVHLEGRTKNLDKRLMKIHCITDNRFSKTRLGRTQDLTKRIAKAIVKKFKLEHDNLLLNLNKDQMGLGVFEKEMKDNFNCKITSPLTKGVNNLKSNTLVACMFNLDLDISTKRILSDITGLSFEQLDTYIHRNNVMQNLFRGTLRKVDSEEVCDFIAPSKGDAEYLQTRLLNELGLKVDIELLDDDINKLFVAGVNGRPTLNKNGVSVEGNIKKSVSRYRKKYGNKVDDHEPNYFVGKMKGLRGEKAQNMFDSLVSNNEKNKSTSVELKQESQPVIKLVVNNENMFKQMKAKSKPDYSNINFG